VTGVQTCALPIYAPRDRSNFLINSDEVCLTRMRLCVASDWVDPFERALDASRRFAKGA
jgi:hypothetical protein